MIRLAILLSTLLIAGSAEAERVYANAQAKPNGDGSKDRPFHTIAAAVQASKPGDTIDLSGKFRQETLREALNLRFVGTFDGECALILIDCADLVLEDIIFNAALGARKDPSLVLQQCSRVEVKDCLFEMDSESAAGMSLKYHENIVVQSCKFVSTGPSQSSRPKWAINAENPYEGFEILRNTFYDNLGIKLTDRNYPEVGCRIINNRFKGDKSSGDEQEAIWVQGHTSIEIRANTIQNYERGIVIRGNGYQRAAVILDENVVKGCESGAVDLEEVGEKFESCEIRSNEFIDNDRRPDAAATVRIGESREIEFTRNLVSVTHVTTPLVRFFEVPKRFVSNRNSFSSADGGLAAFIVEQKMYRSFAEYQKETGFDARSTIDAPKDGISSSRPGTRIRSEHGLE